MAKKEIKRKNLKLRRRLRKTLGAVCLITALLIALIPVPETKAAEDKKYLWDEQIWKGSAAQSSSVIPVVPADCDTIYTTGDGTYQFAFVNASSTSPDKVAIILGYNAGNLADNKLVIPDSVDAFTKYNENLGSRTGYVAVSRSQKPLYYKANDPVYEEDVSGNPVLVKEAEFRACYYADYKQWSTLDLADFYYRDTTGDTSGTVYKGDDGYNYRKTESTAEQWIKNITVMYIGNQSLMANPLATGDGAVQEWVVAEPEGTINTNPDNGVFANEGNIRTLVVGERLMGIGNYAFYGCTGLESITLGNGLTEMGHHAFANCVNMAAIGLDFNSRLQYISDYTFLNCRALMEFTLPASVTKIYDHAFEGCTNLGLTAGTLDIAGVNEGKNVTLDDLGVSVFKGCTRISDLTLPESITGKINLNNFEGCNGLKRIKVESPYTDFKGDYTGKDLDFLSWVDPTFYFEADGSSTTHTFTKANAIAFKYADRDCYEIIKRETATDGSTAELTYQVNSNNELLYFNMNKKVAEVTIPTTIGPYGISAINSGSFSGNCFLEKITIPATVHDINESAFKGCHNLKDVIFEDAGSVQYIGQNAFATQLVDGVHATGCPNESTYLKSTPVLRFTGTVADDCIPYLYAMSADSNINAGQQPKTYITYFSGWPTNLEVQYVANASTGYGMATLVDYPKFRELTTKYTASNYPYITADYEDAARKAVAAYNSWLTDSSTEVTSDQWDIINAALRPDIPSGVKAVKQGLFSNAAAEKNANGSFDLNADGTYAVKKVNSSGSADTDVKEITFRDIKEFEPYTITGCQSLEKINIFGAEAVIDDYAFAYDYTTHGSDISDAAGSDSSLTSFYMPTSDESSVGDYAFNNNAKLNNVTLSPNVTEMGLRPFRDCPILENVSFGGGPNFTTDNAIIYGLDANGSKKSIVQCLESRGKLNTPGSVSASELAGVTEIAKEAFMDCGEVGQVDLSTSAITTVPENAFRNTASLYSVKLPTTCKSISKYAFHDSNVRYLEIPSSVTYLDPTAFNTPQNLSSNGDYKTIEFYCEAGSAAETYAGEYININVTNKPASTTFKVIFWDYDGSVLSEQEVLIGMDAVAPADPKREGYVFEGWIPSDFTKVSRNMDITAQYRKIDSEETKFTVRFIDYDDKVLYTQKVAAGEDAILPQAPTRTGYTFTGWRPAITNIQKDTDVYAQYEKNSTGNNGGNNGGNGNNGNNGGNGNHGNSTVSGGNASTLYTLTVKNGQGSGSYVAGATVIVIANEPVSNQQFSKWTSDNTSIKFASDTVSATTMVMPAANATVTANYTNKKTNGNAGSGTSGNRGNTSVSGGNSTNKNNNTGGNKTGSTVVIDKNGLSNTGVVSATVKGSSDNFVIKITEDSAASEAVVKALMDEYGSLDNVKYFPMDISLYDSTGKTKITDTTGLSISITLPLPDSMITYAGNNKVAGVVNDKLDKLTPKFTTIDGVSCVTFTAEHFSPYVIYVNTSQLTANGVTDSSPKTGDISPKWFAVIALTGMAVILFVKKDRVYKKVPA